MVLHKKGVSMQVFIFIFALILMALVLGYGLKTLVTIRNVSEDVGIGDFFLRLQDKTNMMYNFDVGSSQDVTLFLPAEVERVCFFNGDKEITLVPLDGTLQNYLETNLGQNVFVMPFVFSKNIFSIDHLRAGGNDNPLCFLTDGRLDVDLKTILGDDGNVYVEVHRFGL
jgi:hypothetical protein